MEEHVKYINKIKKKHVKYINEIKKKHVIGCMK